MEKKIQPISSMEQDWINKLQLSKQLHDKKYENLEHLLVEKESSDLANKNRGKPSDQKANEAQGHRKNSALSRSISSISD